jgi:hypothetical protein
VGEKQCEDVQNDAKPCTGSVHVHTYTARSTTRDGRGAFICTCDSIDVINDDGSPIREHHCDVEENEDEDEVEIHDDYTQFGTIVDLGASHSEVCVTALAIYNNRDEVLEWDLTVFVTG